jgi:hypothetical protein
MRNERSPNRPRFKEFQNFDSGLRRWDSLKDESPAGFPLCRLIAGQNRGCWETVEIYWPGVRLEISCGLE